MAEPRNWLSRKEAAQYLTARGRRITPQALANMAANGNAGKGPAFTRFGWKCVQYARVDLDAWIEREKRRFE